jgi:organic hydroperoxide reductase OsmC/OhrA
MGGKGDGQNPEQLFAMGYACKLSLNAESSVNLRTDS